ncbi:glycosyltransferase [Planktomarina temperata]|nr:glycosyltransferase [Planktomarina temperata]
MITIITASFNSENTIARCISSVKSQNFSDWEHLIIDGGSSDRTIDIVKEMDHQRLRFVSEPDDGIYHAFNKGIRIAKGSIIGFLNSDDEYFDQSVLELIHNCFAHGENVAAVYGNLVYVSEQEKVVRDWVSGDFNPQKFVYGWMIPHPTLYCKRELFSVIGSFDEKFRIAGDFDHQLRLAKSKVGRVTYTNNYFVKMYLGGISNRSLKHIIQKILEDFTAFRNNEFSILAAFIGVILKNVRKLKQLRIGRSWP